MSSTEFYMVAFAAFTLIKVVRLPALLCLFVISVTYTAENITDEYYHLYYVISFLSCLLCATFILKFPNEQHIAHATLFCITMAIDTLGYAAYKMYFEPTLYNFLGNLAIISQMAFLGWSAGGGIRNFVNSINNAFSRFAFN